MSAEALRFHEDGAQRLAGTVLEQLARIEVALAGLPVGEAGLRLQGIGALTPLLASGSAIADVAGALLRDNPRAVRAILFDKTAGANWGLGWHQDRVIAVRSRVETPGFGPWTVKQGMTHVAPPFEILAGMVTLRVHLDDVPDTNAPLLIAPGSHRLGRIAEDQIAAAVEQCGTATCLARRGDIWAYATPILHASEPARCLKRRRVLQVDFASQALPGGLEWLGV